MPSEKSVISSQMLNQTLIKRLIYAWMFTPRPSEGKTLEKLAQLHKCAYPNQYAATLGHFLYYLAYLSRWHLVLPGLPAHRVFLQL